MLEPWAMVRVTVTPELTLSSIPKLVTVAAWFATNMLPFVKSALLMLPPPVWVQVTLGPPPPPPKSATPLQSLSWPSQASVLPG